MSIRKLLKITMTFLKKMDKIILNNTETYDEPIVGVIDGIDISAKVILFNDDVHSFDEVIEQLIKAINCSYDRAESLAFEVHNKGKACVYDGDLNECLRVSAILEEIALHTQIEY